MSIVNEAKEYPNFEADEEAFLYRTVEGLKTALEECF